MEHIANRTNHELLDAVEWALRGALAAEAPRVVVPVADDLAVRDLDGARR